MNYIMLHHTWPGNSQALAEYLAFNPAQVSCHYTVSREGKVRKHCDDDKVCWHAWSGSWYWIANNSMNYHSIGIEVCSDWNSFTDEQRKVVKGLLQQLTRLHKIPVHNVIRHLDWTSRKRDIGDNFRNGNYRDWQDYQNKLTPTDLEEKLWIEATKNWIPTIKNKKLKKVMQVLLKYVESGKS